MLRHLLKSATWAIIGLTAACDGNSQLSEQGRALTATLSQLNLANPVADVEAALARGDTRFIGINGFTCFAPGLETASQPQPGATNLKCLEGTSDVIVQGEKSLRQSAVQYARTYNRELVVRMDSGRLTIRSSGP